MQSPLHLPSVDFHVRPHRRRSNTHAKPTHHLHHPTTTSSSWKNDYTLFIPELPGYGISTLPSTSTNPPTYNKRHIGEAIISALHKVLGPSSQTRPIHWIAHDRGARIGHRLLTSPSPPANLKSAVFIDIVPTLEQWRAFAHPAASVAYFHWPFLAMGTAPQVIKGMGGEAFCRMILARGRGANSLGHRKIDSEDAYDHYAKVFDRDEAIEGSCADYAGGAVEECQAQEEEQAAGQKVRVPLLVIYSEGSLGKMNDVEGIWPKWAEKGVEGVRFVGVGDGHGHYLPESADGLVAQEVVAPKDSSERESVNQGSNDVAREVNLGRQHSDEGPNDVASVSRHLNEVDLNKKTTDESAVNPTAQSKFSLTELPELQNEASVNNAETMPQNVASIEPQPDAIHQLLQNTATNDMTGREAGIF